MGLEELKQKYNEFIKREQKARKWMDTANSTDIDKWMPSYIKITIQLSKLMQQYKDITGKKMTDKEVFGGFE